MRFRISNPEESVHAFFLSIDLRFDFEFEIWALHSSFWQARENVFSLLFPVLLPTSYQCNFLSAPITKVFKKEQ